MLERPALAYMRLHFTQVLGILFQRHETAALGQEICRGT